MKRYNVIDDPETGADTPRRMFANLSDPTAGGITRSGIRREVLTYTRRG